ncbi:hypothetical protein [Advenella sp. FME57]|uniref:hypothetical protein n=1 Tax=Advenella sp. FME57 TaxID=2742604 RepID=UPI00351C21D1
MSPTTASQTSNRPDAANVIKELPFHASSHFTPGRSPYPDQPGARYRRIDSTVRSGKVYLIGLVLSVVTAFGLSSSGGFNVGHALGILALLAV